LVFARKCSSGFCRSEKSEGGGVSACWQHGQYLGSVKRKLVPVEHTGARGGSVETHDRDVLPVRRMWDGCTRNKRTTTSCNFISVGPWVWVNLARRRLLVAAIPVKFFLGECAECILGRWSPHSLCLRVVGFSPPLSGQLDHVVRALARDHAVDAT
jgi:hypothetical protein